MRGSPASYIIACHRAALTNGLELTLDEVEAHHLCGGDPGEVIEQILKANECDLELSWDLACAIDMATKGTLENLMLAVDGACNTSSHTFDHTRSPNKASQQPNHLRVTLNYRVELSRFVGGATLDTIEQRVHRLLDEICSSQKLIQWESLRQHLEQEVMSHHLDSGTRLRLSGCEITQV